MYKLQEIQDKDPWNNFIIDSHFEFYSFLQSWQWWEIQLSVGKKLIRMWIYKDKTLVGAMQVIKVYAKRGSYYFVPHGPLIKQDYFAVLEWVTQQLRNMAKDDGMDFIRFNPTVTNTQLHQDSYAKLWFKRAPMHEHAEDTHLLDITLDEETLFSNIKKKDRYYINRANKEGVEVRIDNKKDHIETLIAFHEQHSNRTNGKVKYHGFSREFIYSLYDVFDAEQISTVSASYNGQIESILMTIQFGTTCVYYIAASDIKSPKFSPNYLCQWSAILHAKSQWAQTYNFWWISPDDNPKHPIAGVTKFKRKFAGYDYSLLHAQDLIISPKYYLNWCVETIRRINRGYYYKKPE